MLLRFFHRLIKPLPLDVLEKIIAEISAQASAGFDFYLLVILSTSIATLGLITDSPAVIIGAMLVAPLMSPLIGIGLASITGATSLLKKAIQALLRGAFLAILLSALVTLINTYLPIISFQSLPGEVIARTRPTPIDLVIALSGGLAAAYAMTQPNISAALPGVAIATALMPPLCTVGIGLALSRIDVAVGAFLLFLTNAVTIAFAAVLVFFLRGFGASPKIGQARLPRSLIFSATLTLLLFIPLNYYSIRFFREAAENRQIQAVVQDEVHQLGNTEVVELNFNRLDDTLEIEITVRTGRQLRYEQVVGLQEAIVEKLDRSVSLKINQIFAELLDPLIPPTPSLTPTVTRTNTPGPSPTATKSPTPTATASATVTQTSTHSPSPFPSGTPTNTSTPQPAQVIQTGLPKLQIYQKPGGPVIGSLLAGQSVQILYHQEIYQGLVWMEVMDQEGRVGWVPLIFLNLLTATPQPVQ